MHRTLFAAALTVACLFSGSTAHALSCQGRLIERGTPSARVRALCGPPASVTQSVLTGSSTIGAGPYWLWMQNTMSRSFVIEKWVYDFGPSRFMEELTFANGNLRRIRELGYGTSQGHAKAAPAQDAGQAWAWLERSSPPVASRRRRIA